MGKRYIVTFTISYTIEDAEDEDEAVSTAEGFLQQASWYDFEVDDVEEET